MTTLPAYPVYRVMANARYLGVWFRVERGRLFITGDTSKLTDDLRDKIKAHKPEITDAVAELPDSCTSPTVCLNVGYCDQCQRVDSESVRAQGNGHLPYELGTNTAPADFAGFATFQRDLNAGDTAYHLDAADIAEAEDLAEEMHRDNTWREDVYAKLQTENDPRTEAQLRHAVAVFAQAREVSA